MIDIRSIWTNILISVLPLIVIDSRSRLIMNNVLLIPGTIFLDLKFLRIAKIYSVRIHSSLTFPLWFSIRNFFLADLKVKKTSQIHLLGIVVFVVFSFNAFQLNSFEQTNSVFSNLLSISRNTYLRKSFIFNVKIFL